MIHEFCDNCGWVSYPASQDSHICHKDPVSYPDPVFVMGADWSDDSDY